MRTKGQALIETLVILSIYTMVWISVFQISFLVGARAYVRHQLYQALICIAQNETPKLCRKTLIQQSQKFLAWGELKNIQLKGEKNQWIGTLTLSIHPWDIDLRQKLHFKKDLSL